VRCLVLCQYRSTVDLLATLFGSGGDELHFVVEELRLARYVQERSLPVTRGPFRQRATYEGTELRPRDLILVDLRQKRRLPGVVKFLDRIRNGCPVLVLLHGSREELALPAIDGLSWVHTAALGDLLGTIVDAQIRLARSRDLAARAREVVAGARNVLILIQDDPDPDALASALGLRQIFGRNRTTCPIATFGRVFRPENLAMLRLLEIELLEQIPQARLAEFDRIALVDTQPSRFGNPLPRVDVVVDHHPDTGFEAPFRDVRTGYGATSTIVTEYLRAQREKISGRLATALLYGIRTDTLLLERDVAEADVEAFTHLYPLASTNVIRRIERPELPQAVLPAFSDALRRSWIEERVIFSHLGEVDREDVIPHLADFCLQVQGVEWSVVSGIHDTTLVIAVRNVGFVRAAGEVVRDAFAAYGSAGGHRSMAKAVIPLDAVPGGEQARVGWIRERLLDSLASSGKAPTAG
jgi:nanoRNase/pAp phosphatase (c-di-AMP/oligoRNAs hydrolase)